MAVPQIIAMGGGGFSMEAENSPLDDYILAATAKPNPRVLFLPTASGDADSYIVRFYSAFNQKSCRPAHLKFFERTPDLRSTLLKQDVIYVGGGNTKSMLAVWREWGMSEILEEAWQQGIVLAGLSAGALCWFEQGVTDSWGDRLRGMNCLGLLPGSCCPHYDSEPERPGAYSSLVEMGEILPGYALDDLAGAHFESTRLRRIVASNANARGYQVTRVDRGALVTLLEAEVLSRV